MNFLPEGEPIPNFRLSDFKTPAVTWETYLINILLLTCSCVCFFFQLSRQRYMLGDGAMIKMAQSKVFLSGLGGLGIEIGKILNYSKINHGQTKKRQGKYFKDKVNSFPLFKVLYLISSILLIY